jgi:hypothetical protein
MTTTALCAVVALSGCGSKDASNDDDFVAPVTFGDDDDDTSDTAGSGPKRVVEFSFGGWFGYDDVLQEIVPVINNGNDQPSIFYIELRSQAFVDGDSSDYCWVRVYLDGYTGDSFAGDDGFPFGYTVPQGTASGGDDCIEQGFDPDDPYWDGSDPFSVFSDPDRGWAVAIGGDPSQAAADWLNAAPEDEQNYIGGEFLGTDYSIEDKIYWLAWELDDSYNILTDNRMTRDAIVDGNSELKTGYYQFDVMVHVD